MPRKKITIVGAGNVGSSAVAWAAAIELGDIVLVDVVEGLAKGKALDVAEGGPILGFDARVTGTTSYKETADSDLVIITAGMPRKPGMTREDLLNTNKEIVAGVAREIARRSPDAVIIVVTNPLDAMCHVVKAVTGFPRERVIGMAGILDTARFRAFVAMELGVSIEDVSAFVLGGHGDAMVPVTRYSAVAGVPVEQLISKARLDQIVKRVRDGGAEIVGLLKTGSAFYAPASSAIQMAESILRDKKRVLPCSCYLEGEYGFKNTYLGVPCLLGAEGMEKIFEVTLSEDEKAALKKSAESVQEQVKLLNLPELEKMRNP